MPELPEVETIRRDLEQHLVGRRVAAVRVRRRSVLLGTPRRLRAAVCGARVEAVQRHGKVLILGFSSGYSLLVHLRMTGQLLLRDGQAGPRFARLAFELAEGGALVYADCRALGRLEVCGSDSLGCSRALARFGPDALAPEAPARLAEAIARRRTPIKCLLLDQSVIAGIGNIYASEILHAARVAPDRPAGSLSPAERHGVCRATQKVLTAAIARRGTTFRDFRTGTGEPGQYASRLRVYGREGGRCLRRGCTGTTARCVQQQRSTFWCPECQR